MVKAPIAGQSRRQPRSLQTERKLMAAAIALMDKEGLEACTAPALARQAGVAVGTIYARYPDKDAVISAALLDMVSLGDGARDAEITAVVREAADLRAFLAAVTRTSVKVTRDHRVLLLAIRAFVGKTSDSAWRLRFQAHQGHARELLTQAAIARFGAEVRGGGPALRMALAAIYGAVEVTWLDPITGLFETAPSEAGFVEALVDMQLRYLA